MSFLIWLLTSISMISQQVLWENDDLTLKLGDSIGLYQDLPSAHLYINGIEVNDPNMYIEKGVERTFLSTVNTSIVRSYTIKYRVTFPNYSITQTHSIIFNVIDDIPPKIEFMPTFNLPLGSKMPDIAEGLKVSDNYDIREDLVITTKVEEVMLNIIGTYIIEYHVADQSNNLSIGYSYITVYDATPPTVTVNKPFLLNYKQPFRWQDYMTVKDNYDQNPLVEIDDQHVDYETLGTYLITISVKDQSGNTNNLTAFLVIIDSEKPVIILKSNPKPITIYSHISRDILEDYILSISDNHDDLTLDDVVITDDIDHTRIGEYNIYFELTDSSLNQTIINMKVKVIDDVKPTITIIKPLTLEVFNQSPYLTEYFEFSDNSSQTSDLIIKFTGTIDMKKLGRYLITVEVTDQAKNKTVNQYYFDVVDQIAPQIILKTDIIITDFEKKDFKNYIEVTDNYNLKEELRVTFDDSMINYNVIGRYDLIMCVKDLSNNETCETFDVMILDIIPPRLELTHHFITIDVKDDRLDLTSFIALLEDNYDQKEDIELIIESEIDFGVIGLYEVIFRLIDTSFNQSVKTLVVKVDYLSLLTYTFVHLDILQDESIDYLEGLFIDENVLGYKVIYDAKHVDISVPGYYEINYVIIDQRGRHYQFTRGLTIHKTTETQTMTSYIPLVILNGLFLGVIYYLWRKN